MKIFIAAILLFSCNAEGLDFGKQGNSFPVKEEGFIAMIQRKLASVDLSAHQEQMRTHAKSVIEEPAAVIGITRTIKTVSHSFDPSYTLQEDIILPCGKLLYRAGETINPLDHMSWDGKLLFIDARDHAQVAWVVENYLKTEIKESSQNNKIVLVAGKPLELERNLQQPIYFDQAGELTSKFNISYVPAIVEQDKQSNYLKVTEVDIGGYK